MGCRRTSLPNLLTLRRGEGSLLPVPFGSNYGDGAQQTERQSERFQPHGDLTYQQTWARGDCTRQD